MISTDEIIKPYLSDLNDIDWEECKQSSHSPDLYLFHKWAYRVDEGWYGFAMSNCPMLWAIVIDNFLKELVKVAPNFKIHQIKLKFGGLRFYVELGLDDKALNDAIHQEIGKLEQRLFNEKLIY